MKKTILHCLSRNIGFLILACLSLQGCNYQKSNELQTPEDTEKIAFEIHNVFKDFTKAYATLDVELVTNLYMEDALYLSGSEEITKGRSEIRKGFQRYFEWADTENTKLTIDFDFHDEIYTNDMCSVVGYYLIKMEQKTTEGSTEKKSCGKFITVLQKDKSGQWKFISDAYNEAPVEAFRKPLKY